MYNGNISLTQWRTANTDNSLKTYNYTYDALNRIISATDNLDRYSLSNVSYDKNGNILNLTRKGHIVAEPVWSNSADFDVMDDLTYTYQPNSNKLLKVSDAIVTPANVRGEFKDDHNYSTPDPTNDYTYDANGNMKTDTNKGITNINYNHLNLPTLISINGMGQTGTINYIYDATGVKLSKQVIKSGEPDTYAYYAGNYIYEGSSLKFFSHPEGYVDAEGGDYQYIYQYKDHLGNIRLNYKDISTTSTPLLEIIEENNYYPFGLEHKGYNYVVNGTEHKWKFNGKELEEELGLNSYDYSARSYMPDLGRWKSIDPQADSYFSVTPYSSFANNPISFVDPTGEDILFWQWEADDELTLSGTWKQVSYNQLDSKIQEGLENFAKTKEGFAILSKFANKGDKIGSVVFGENGEYANHNLNFSELGDGHVEGNTPPPINRSVFGPMREGKTNNYIDFYINIDRKMSNSSINIPETIAHEAFGHLDQYLDDYVKAFEKSGASGANAIYSNYEKNNSEGYQDHFNLAGGKVKKYNTFITQLKSIFNPQSVQKHVDAERDKNLKEAKKQKARANE